MKYIRQEDNRFIFEDGEKEIEALFEYIGEDCTKIHYEEVCVWDDFEVGLTTALATYKDIQTAVQMMTILKEKRLV